MKKFISNFISTLLYKRGFALVPVADLKLWHRERNNFKNLSGAYELQMRVNRQGVSLPRNPKRWELLARQYGTPPSEAYIIIEALAKTMNLEGDVCEFGVAQGELSAVLANEIMDTPKRLHLFDSFEGLPMPSDKDKLIDDVLNLGSMEAYAGKMANPENLVISRLKSTGFPNERTKIHKGFFENLIPQRLGFPKKVAFAYIDFDFHDPIKQALEFLDEVACPGAIFVVDDYDYFSTGAKDAVDAFVDKKNSQSQTYNIEIPDKALAHCAVISKL